MHKSPQERGQKARQMREKYGGAEMRTWENLKKLEKTWKKVKKVLKKVLTNAKQSAIITKLSPQKGESEKIGPWKLNNNEKKYKA